jgi:predicted nucleic acid-binding protein
LEAIATSDSEKIGDDSVALAMKLIFSQLEINELDIADGLKELLYKKYDLNSILQTDAPFLSSVNKAYNIF